MTSGRLPTESMFTGTTWQGLSLPWSYPPTDQPSLPSPTLSHPSGPSIWNPDGPYQLLLALNLVSRLPLQLLLGLQRSQTVGLEALRLLLGSLPLILQLQGSLDLVGEFWGEATASSGLQGALATRLTPRESHCHVL